MRHILIDTKNKVKKYKNNRLFIENLSYRSLDENEKYVKNY